MRCCPNFTRKATVCLLSFIPICAESEAVGMVITMYEQDNPLKTVELSTEQNYNMIDGLLNNGPALPPQPPEKELDKVKEPPNKHRSREREYR